jgi:serine/threonine-protein kinase
MGGPRDVRGYLLGAAIARGGMGAVHVAIERATGRVVALKRLRAALATDPDFVTMFLDEARLAGAVQHPNVVVTLGVIEDAAELFLAMEYVDGASLASAFSAGQVPPPIAARVFLDVLAGLEAAHEARDEEGAPLELVHRDVSPQNVLVGVNGVARVTDFGIARARGRAQGTTPGQLKGKLRYMAPEQLRGAEATRQSDVYSAAVVLWEALTGARLFQGASHPQIFGQVLEGIITPPDALAAVSTAVSEVVLRGLARDPLARFPTAKAMAEALERALPPAPAASVSAWIQDVAARELSARAASVEALVRGATDDDSRREGHDGRASLAGTEDEETPTLPRVSRSL